MPVEFIVIGVTSPTLAAIWTQWLVEGNLRICHLFTRWYLMLFGLVGGVALMFLACSVAPAMMMAKPSPRAVQWVALLLPASYAVNWSTFFGGPVNEEPGWRGFALPRLQARFGPVLGSMILGLIWAGWHLPLFLLRGWISVPVWAFVLILVCVSILITWMTNLGRTSIFVPISMHVAFNMSAQLLGKLLPGTSTRSPELAFFLAGMITTTLTLVLLTCGGLGFQRTSTSSTTQTAA
ncbi:MAG: CPBP family intramembrane glutamic endopeptidase [Acidobacteriaceae bacterium]